MCTRLLWSRFKNGAWMTFVVRTMISSQWCWASKNALTSGVVIRGARFPYNTERIAEVERRRIESKKSWAAQGGYFVNGGKECWPYFRARQHLVHQLCGLSLLNLRVIPARRLGKNLACTSPEATPLLVWGALRDGSFSENGRNSL